MNAKTLMKVSLCGALVGLPEGARAQKGEAAVEKTVNAQVVEAPTIKVVYEVFSLPMGAAATLQRAGLSDSDFYGKLLAGLKDESVKQEVFMLVRGLTGEKLTGQHGQERIHAAEYEPPELPNTVARTGLVKGQEGKIMPAFPVTPATPSAYQTRVIGESLEVETSVWGEGVIQMRLAPSQVTFLQRDTYGQGLSKVEMPRFANPQIRTAIVARSGRPSYLGTVSQPLELQPEKGEPEVCFAFVTATTVAP
jgi:hypothetical protein